MHLTSDQLSAISSIRHGFFTRQGGVSTGIFAAMNCGGRGSAELAEIVDENRRRVAEVMQLTPSRLLSLAQVHGRNVVTVEAPWHLEDRPEADAMVTRRPCLGLGILTADCAPVLFADRDAGVIGAAHSGWRGTFAGILQAVITAMEGLGAKREHITAVIGPTIAQPSYQVDAAFRQSALERNGESASYFTALDASGHCTFDLPGFVQHQLTALRLFSVASLGLDTYKDEERFYSFRRATHRNEPDYGRQLSVICLKPT